MDTSQSNQNVDKSEDYSKKISAIIHDLNNIMGPVSGYADMILKDNRDSEGHPENAKLDRRMEKIRLCVTKAAEIIEQLRSIKLEMQNSTSK